MRGNHEGSETAAHSVALQGRAIRLPSQTSEYYDLIVIGAGISGLTAAYRYRQAQPQAKILILDNHDDFGGHAKRTEFTVGDRTLITYGGSESLDSPKGSYSPQAHALLKDLGVDYLKLGSYFQQHLYEQDWQLRSGILFNQASFGENKIVVGKPEQSPSKAAAIIQQFPLNEADKQALIELYTQPKDYLAGKTRKQKQRLAATTSYYDFIKNWVKLNESALRYLTHISSEYWGHAINAVSLHEALEHGYPGLDKLGLPAEREEKEPYIYHFPDGNASIARLLVRQLILGIAAGHSMEDIVTAEFDYSRLDQAHQPVRIRLNTTALRLDNQADGVLVTALCQGNPELQAWHGKKCIFAGHSALAPHLIPDMPAAQQKAMKSNSKVPMIYAKIALKNAHAFKKLGVFKLYVPDSPYCLIQLDDPVHIGDYRHARTPDEPIVLHMVRIATAFNGTDARNMYKAGRGILRGQDYAQLEQEALSQVRTLFQLADESLDDALIGIALHRWAHGYSYEQVGLWDNDSSAAAQTDLMRQAGGHIHMAGTDVAWMPYLQNAIDEAVRAVGEIVPLK